MIEVEKVWGKEVEIINCVPYCGKFLHIDRGAQGSYHYHKIKKETFYCLEGCVVLNKQGFTCILTPNALPITIYQEEAHSFTGLGERNILLEISSTHSDDDTYRIEESRAGVA